MNKKFKELWDEAFTNAGEKVPLGDLVICDICNQNYTGSTESGGFIFGSYSYCPTCAVSGLLNIKKYDEEDYIRARCPKDVSFADFVREYRGPNSFIRVSQLRKKP